MTRKQGQEHVRGKVALRANWWRKYHKKRQDKWKEAGQEADIANFS